MTDDVRFTNLVKFYHTVLAAAAKFVFHLLKATKYIAEFRCARTCKTIPNEQQLPCNFFLFPKTNMQLKEKRFEDMAEIQVESQGVLLNIKK